MLVGLTYDLRRDYLAMGFSEEEVAEFDSPATVDAIEQALRGLGYRTDRIGNLKSLVERLAQGARWDLVFNIAEGLNGFGRESQVPALLDYFSVPYTFADPLTLALTLHKGMAKRVVRDQGLPTPGFAVVENEAQAAAVDLPFPLFAKPVAEGTGRGVTPLSKVEDRARLVAVCRELLARYQQPVLVETFLPGREFTVGVLGTGPEARALGVMEVELLAQAEAGVYSYVNKEECESRVRYFLADDAQARRAAEVALQAYRALGCRDAGRVDLRCDAKGLPHFLEVNPLAGLHPEHSDLPILCSLAGVTFRELIEGVVDSACRRLPPASGLAGGPWAQRQPARS
ncbi:D-alanine--D-alanine ligase [Desulfocarbo indianensis]|nr:D-alanine--D-alanine ligase [Desulfocarbo indianensis]